jgi:hypothetical protein
MKILFKIIFGVLAFLSVTKFSMGVIPQTLTPLCSDNQTAFVSLDNTSGNYGFYACYTKPEAFKIKIVKASLVKADGSGVVDIFTPSTPTYEDLIAGEVNLLRNLDLSTGTYNGTYSGIQIIFDNELQIKAKADYAGTDLPSWSGRVGTKGFCHTLAYNAGTTPAYLDSFAGTANGNPNKFGDSPTFTDSEGASFTNPGLTTFRYLGSPMVGAGITGVDRVYVGSTGTTEGAYWAKVNYSANGAATSADFSVLDTNYSETRRPNLYDATLNRDVRNAYFGKYVFNFANNLVLSSTTNQTIEIKFDLSKAIGFSWNYSTSGDGNYAYTAGNSAHSDGGTYYYNKGRNAADAEESGNNYPDCLRMFIGQVGLVLNLVN